MTSLSYSADGCWCERFSSSSAFSQCNTGGVSGGCSTLMLVTLIVGVLLCPRRKLRRVRDKKASALVLPYHFLYSSHWSVYLEDTVALSKTWSRTDPHTDSLLWCKPVNPQHLFFNVYCHNSPGLHVRKDVCKEGTISLQGTEQCFFRSLPSSSFFLHVEGHHKLCSW